MDRLPCVLPLLIALGGCTARETTPPVQPTPLPYFCCDSVPDWDDDCQAGSPVRKEFDKTTGQCVEVSEEAQETPNHRELK